MSRLVIQLRALTVCLAHPSNGEYDDGAQTELASACLLIADVLAGIKEPGHLRRRPAVPLISPQSPSTPTPTSTWTPQTNPTPSSPIQRLERPNDNGRPVLPTELLPLIFRFLTRPRDRHAVLLVSRRWHRAAVVEVWGDPSLATVAAVRAFAVAVEDNPACAAMVQRLQFSRDDDREGDGGSATSARRDPTRVFDKAYSSLFRLLIVDRKGHTRGAAHPLFFALALHCPRLKVMDEVPPDDDAARDAFFATQTVLQSLLKACKIGARVARIAGVHPADLTRAYSLLLSLWEPEEGGRSDIWRPEELRSVEIARGAVLPRARDALNRLSTCMFLEAQYLALSAQRLLDRYALMYYRGHARGARLDTQFPTSSHDGADVVLRGLRVLFRQPDVPSTEHSDAEEDEESDLDQEAEEEEEEDREDPDAPWTVLPAELAALAAMDNPDRPPLRSPRNRNPFAFPARAFLDDALSLFPPISVNSETSELLSALLQEPRSQRRPAGSGPPRLPTATSAAEAAASYRARTACEEWLEWFRDIVMWQKGGVEMESVKELLRASMARMEMFRELQVRASFSSISAVEALL
ncbi:hypothetical protein HKX48_008909 [Thoreauomyces humboldtii]|nr:hypothetical protein HKX48_008909 [Thoreauomyces humboldtii]